MDAFTAQQTIELVSRIGAKKAYMRFDKLVWNSFLSGPLLGFGCAVLLSIEASPWYAENAPGLLRLMGALMFPIGLVMMVLTGSELFTSNLMFMTTAFVHRRVTIKDVAISWTVSFFGNLAGSLFFAIIVFGYGGVFDAPVYRNAVITFVISKAQTPQWHQIFLRAIGANYLVCMAVFLSISSREVVSKVTAIWWPTATFVALGLDHTVANMFFIPLGIHLGAPFGAGYYIWKSLIPTVLGNFVGGGLFMGATYWYLYLTGEVGVQLSFSSGSMGTAMEVGGPMRDKLQPRHRRDTDATQTEVLEGVDVSEQSDHANGNMDVPKAGGQLMSGLMRDYGDDTPYAKSHAERMGQVNGEKV